MTLKVTDNHYGRLS